MSPRIRDYAAADYPAVLSLIEAVLVEYGFSMNVGGVQRDLETAFDRHAKSKAGFWVAELDGAVIGTVAVRPKDDRTCELKRLYVRTDARGHGIGQALYAHAEAFARAAGYGRIWLDSSRRFVQARRLYERNGFALLEELRNDWEDNVYEKRLSLEAGV
jgi:GNAT superfamily N-acetyltransferase